MKMRPQSSIRWRLLLAFFLSIALAIFSVFVLLFMALVLSQFEPIHLLLEILDRSLGPLAVCIIIGFILFILYFFLFTQKTISYIEEINQKVNLMAKGDFSVMVPLRTRDELGLLAENINTMSVRLKESIEEERLAERTKTELITSVSHDLRTPLTSIIGYLDLVVNDRYRDELALRYYADIAYHKSKRLQQLIDELFEYTRVSYGGMKAVYDKINLVELLEQLTEEFVPLLQEASMVCRLTPAQKKIFVMADANLLVRVFENLLTNAIRYGKDGKYIDIEVLEGDSVVVRVTNYGEPIPARDLPHLFDRFYRVEKSRSLDSGGSGLGLAIAQSIITLHGGKITAQSDTSGTTFEVTLDRMKE